MAIFRYVGDGDAGTLDVAICYCAGLPLWRSARTGTWQCNFDASVQMLQKRTALQIHRAQIFCVIQEMHESAIDSTCWSEQPQAVELPTG